MELGSKQPRPISDKTPAFRLQYWRHRRDSCLAAAPRRRRARRWPQALRSPTRSDWRWRFPGRCARWERAAQAHLGHVNLHRTGRLRYRTPAAAARLGKPRAHCSRSGSLRPGQRAAHGMGTNATYAGDSRPSPRSHVRVVANPDAGDESDWRRNGRPARASGRHPAGGRVDCCPGRRSRPDWSRRAATPRSRSRLTDLPAAATIAGLGGGHYGRRQDSIDLSASAAARSAEWGRGGDNGLRAGGMQPEPAERATRGSWRGCGAALTSAPGGRCGLDTGTLKIGLLSGFSGPYAAFGPDMASCCALFLEQHDGLVGGLKATVIQEDESATPQEALLKARKLVEQDRVDADAIVSSADRSPQDLFDSGPKCRRSSTTPGADDDHRRVAESAGDAAPRFSSWQAGAPTGRWAVAQGASQEGRRTGA